MDIDVVGVPILVLTIWGGTEAVLNLLKMRNAQLDGLLARIRLHKAKERDE